MRTLDLLVEARRVYPMEEPVSWVNALAVDAGKVVALGDPKDLDDSFLFRRRLDLGEGILYPGFMDPHSHFLSYGLLLGRARLFGERSWAAAVAEMRRFSETATEEWIVGRGWDQNLWPEGTFPDNALLDAAFPARPAVAIRVDGHAAVVNSAALRAAGIGTKTRIPGGLVVLRDGKPTGMLLDKAVDRIRATIPSPDEAAIKRALLAAQDNCFAAGLTSVSNAGTAEDEVLLMRRMLAEGALSIGLYVMLMADEPNFRRFAGGPLVEGRLTVRSFKAFADGALGSRGAFLLEPYEDEPGSRGLSTISAEELDDVCAFAAERGFQVNTHAIGDAAFRLVMEVYERHLGPGNDLRWRVEHAQLVHDDDLRRLGRLNVIPSVQTTHATSDMRWTKDRLGAWRMGRSHRYRDLLMQNGWLANGSDFPIEAIEPLRGFRSAVFRKDDGGKPEGGYLPSQSLSRLQALKAMTCWAARANFEEKERGSLSSGKSADFTVLDVDLLEDPEEKLWEARVLSTWVEGRAVFGGG